MREITLWGVCIIALLALQSTVIPMLAVQGGKADLMLLVVVSAALIGGRNYGVAMGFSCGLLQDLAAGGFFGLHLLSKLTIGYALGMTEGKVYKDNRLLPILAAGATSIAAGVLILLLLAMLGQKISWLNSLSNVILPSAAYNMVLALLVHRFMQRIFKVIE
ncbi:rod shape-determining protein MreD [Azotosporobacter soli]|uniref:rod shape-determining protein MreD n=1 Tax=Azotosporobacter soli TaxID=3055040 RepID=UPI0031FF0BC6